VRLIRAVESHCGGPHCRVVFGGKGELDIPGATMFEKKRFLETHRDEFRQLMLGEPRSSPTTNVDLILPPADPRADVGLVIMEQAPYYPPMSGGNVICVVTVLLETGFLQMQEPVTTVTLDTPAGLVVTRAQCENGRVRSVTFANAPSFVTHLDVVVDVPELGPVTLDIAYGGMFYALAEAAPIGLRIVRESAAELATLGERIKNAARAQIQVRHPENPAIDHLENFLWWAPPHDAANDGRNAVVISLDAGTGPNPHGVLDRCPCGTGTSARLAVLHARGQIAEGADFRHEGILDSVFTGRIVGSTHVGGTPALLTEISGQAWISGYSDHVVQDDDPFPHGFVLRDFI
jgi:proline racemase